MAPRLLPRRTATSPASDADGRTQRGSGPRPSPRDLRHRPDGRVAVTCFVVLLLVVLMAPTGQAHASGEPHPHVVITLTYPYVNDDGGDLADGGAADGDDAEGRDAGLLELVWTGRLTVNETAAGARYVQVPVPWSEEALERFEPASGWPGQGDHEVIVNDTGGHHLRWTWTAGAPEPGVVLEDVEVQMSNVLTFTPDASFHWSELGHEATVTVEVPVEVDVVHQGVLIRSYHNDPDGGRQSYFQTRLSGPLDLTFRPAEADVVDAGRAAPPWPGWSWAIIIGLASTSALVWWLGYQIDARRAERDARERGDAEVRDR